METAAQDVVNMSTENKLASVHNICSKSGASKHADTTAIDVEATIMLLSVSS